MKRDASPEARTLGGQDGDAGQDSGRHRPESDTHGHSSHETSIRTWAARTLLFPGQREFGQLFCQDIASVAVAGDSRTSNLYSYGE